MSKDDTINIDTKIEASLDQIRPHLQADGGNVEYISFENGIVKVRFLGMCSGCPSSQMTLNLGIETHLKETIPAVKRVVLVEDEQ